jgi:uncharacterized protein YcgL (UPF0745 family)
MYGELSFGNIWSIISTSAKGWYEYYHRLQWSYHFFSTILFSYILTDFISYRIFNIIFHLACLGLFTVFLKKLTNLPWFILSLATSLIVPLYQYNFPSTDSVSEWFTAHILFFQICLLSFIFHFKALENFKNGIKIYKNYSYFASIIFYGLTLQYYEVAFILFPIYFLIGLSFDLKDPNTKWKTLNWKRHIKIVSPFVLSALIAISFWILAKIKYTTNQNTYNVVEIKIGLNTLYSFFYQFISTFPFANLSVYKNLHEGRLLDLISWRDILYFTSVGIISFAMTKLSSKEKIGFDKKTFINIIILFYIWLALILPVSVSAIYNIRLGSAYPFATIQFYTLQGIFALLIMCIVNKNKQYTNMIAIIVAAIYISSAIVNDLNNKIVIEKKSKAFYLQNNMEYALKNGLLQNLENKKATLIMQKPLQAWTQSAYIFHNSDKILETHQSFEKFLEFHKSGKKGNHYIYGERDNYNFNPKNKIVNFSANDKIYYLMINEEKSITNFKIVKLRKVDFSDKEKIKIFGDEVFEFSVQNKEIIQKKHLILNKISQIKN